MYTLMHTTVISMYILAVFSGPMMHPGGFDPRQTMGGPSGYSLSQPMGYMPSSRMFGHSGDYERVRLVPLEERERWVRCSRDSHVMSCDLYKKSSDSHACMIIMIIIHVCVYCMYG